MFDMYYFLHIGPVEMNSHGLFSPCFTRMTEISVIPFGRTTLQAFWNDNLILVRDEIVGFAAPTTGLQVVRKTSTANGLLQSVIGGLLFGKQMIFSYDIACNYKLNACWLFLEQKELWTILKEEVEGKCKSLSLLISSVQQFMLTKIHSPYEKLKTLSKPTVVS